MGLDMYLYADRYISEYLNPEDKEKAEKIKEIFPELNIGEIRNIRSEIAYWRKANAIHRWFVENVQDGVDDCGDYYVSREQLQELLSVIEDSLKNKKNAKDNLPTGSGFFFGSNSIDDLYFDTLKYSREQIKKVLTLPTDLSIYYHASW